ncbi:MAG: hypothetical protein M3N13_00445, partial [Candidatus Eremiobacteraeota bacterium]|nr:hypothetical protein [Candidatus Eremiobacteraeota bacterium]
PQRRDRRSNVLLRAGWLALILALASAGRSYAQALPAASPSPEPLRAVPAQLDIRAGTSGSVVIGGSQGALVAELQPQIATVSVDQQSRTIVVTAQIPSGRAVLHVSDASGARLDIAVRIAQDAGTVGPSAVLRVTGDPLDPAWLQAQIAATVARSTLVQNGTLVQTGSFTLPPSLAAGSSALVSVPVTIASNDDRYFSVSKTTSVTIENVLATPFTPSLLFYDDDPEKLASDGVLYRGTISAQRPARLYYYHQNGAQPRDLIVTLAAERGPATVVVIDSTAGPNADVLTVGHNATRNFLQMKPANEGVVLDVFAEQPYVLHAIPMGAAELVAGNVDFKVRAGGPITVTVLAAPSGATAAQIAALSAQPQLPGDGHRRTGMFTIPESYSSQTLAYSVGDPDVSTLYGGTTPPPAQAGQAGKDYGDYGVLREIDFDTFNPTGAPAVVYLYEKPQGGVVRSSFVVNGMLHEVGCARVAHAYLIAPFTLAAGQRARIAVTTMTDGASSYPLEVGLTPDPPEGSTPPLFSAEGCFPKPGF